MSQSTHPSNSSPASIVRVLPIADRRWPMLVSMWMSIPRICHCTFKIHLAFEADESVAAGRGLMVREHTSYVPWGTTSAFITISSCGSGFQSSHDTWKSLAKRKQNPINYLQKQPHHSLFVRFEVIYVLIQYIHKQIMKHLHSHIE